mgnify:CR=1 FL=1
MRATQAVIDLKKLKNNAQYLQKKAQGREMMGIIKADAYGHGVIPAMEALLSLGWKYFGVATIEEALELREANREADILILGTTSPEDFPLCVEKGISFAVHDRESLDVALTLEGPAKIHIKVDSGMHRIGFSPEELFALRESVAAINPTGIYTHLARADEEDKSSALAQVSLFKKVVDELKEEGLRFEWVHFANSAAILELDLSFSNMVRAGVALYGLSPGKLHPQLQPVMCWQSRILAVRDIEAGEGVSYGHRFVAESPRRIATVPIGYADGYKRQMSGRIAAWIDGTECPQLGRITMDQVIFDITDTQAKVGDEVELMGEHIPCDRLAEAADTINYEIVTTLGKRVRKVFL